MSHDPVAAELTPADPAARERFQALASRFTFHAASQKQAEKYQEVRQWGHDLALLFHRLCPASPELDRAVDFIDQAVMHANAAIARHTHPSEH